MSIINWVRYSGASIIITLNPLHWRIYPWCRQEITDIWSGTNNQTFSVSFLFLTARVWIDNGNW